MPVTITISEQLFEEIQKQAVPFVDLTPEAVLQRWAEHYKSKADVTRPATVSQSVPQVPAVEGKRFNPMNPPELLHTRVSGQIGGTAFTKWNDLVRLVHQLAFERAGSIAEIQEISRANIRLGDHSGRDGFHFVRALNASIQGLDAMKAWESSFHLAKHYRLPLITRFTWRDNPKAAFPGESGVLEWNPPL